MSCGHTFFFCFYFIQYSRAGYTYGEACGHTGGVWESTFVKLMYVLLASALGIDGFGSWGCTRVLKKKKKKKVPEQVY